MSTHGGGGGRNGGQAASAQTQIAGIVNIYPDGMGNDNNFLAIAFVPPNARMDSLQSAILKSKTNHASYVRCDSEAAYLSHKRRRMPFFEFYCGIWTIYKTVNLVKSIDAIKLHAV